MKKQIILYFAIFIILLIILNAVFLHFGYNDKEEYVVNSRFITDDTPLTSIRCSHNCIYPYFQSMFTNIADSIYTLKIINTIFLLLTTVLLYLTTKKQKTLLLALTSPIIWYLSTAITPLIISSFLFFVSYLYLKKNKLILSGLFLGLTTLFWDASLFIVPIYLLAFFYNKSVKQLLTITIPAIITFSIRILFDLIYFNFPLYSLYRFLGTTYLTLFQMGVWSERIADIPIYNYLLLILIISPLFITLFFHKKLWKTNKEELIFMILSLILFIKIAQPRFMLILFPIAILLLTKTLSKKELLIHTVVSLLIIALLLVPIYQTSQELTETQKDIYQIASDYPNQSFIAGSPSNTLLSENLAALYYGDQIDYIIGYQEYTYLKNNECYQTYTLQSYSTLNNLRQAILTFELCPVEKDYQDFNYLISQEPTTDLEDFELIQEYNTLYLYQLK
mgnify:FL=1